MAGKYDAIIDHAVSLVQGRHLAIGSVAAHPDDPTSRELIAYEDDGCTAVLSWGGEIKRWPASEVFDPNDALDEALRICAENKLRRAAAFANN